ncbi:hypothetical protein [Streptomyces phaeoluteigriseus]|uniref:hypothetical protein n=1 Tax=Streptomyces phaeoluteigriseus TaxID=114686 RepID=UPI003699B7E7
MRDILGRVAPIMSPITAAAATAPEISAQWPAGHDPRYTVRHAAAKALTSKPAPAPTSTPPRAADLVDGLLSPELYLLFFRDRGWFLEARQEWACAALSVHSYTDHE